MGIAELKNQQIEVVKISQSGDNQAVAEVQLATALQFVRGKEKEWHIQSVRLGDRNWIEWKTFLQVLNEVRARQTRETLEKILQGLRKYRQEQGRFPPVASIIRLTDLLVPQYLGEVIRYDAWNRELVYQVSAAGSAELRSQGPDGMSGTSDDIVVTP